MAANTASACTGGKPTASPVTLTVQRDNATVKGFGSLWRSDPGDYIGGDAVILGKQHQPRECQVNAPMTFVVGRWLVDKNKRAASLSHYGFPES